MLCLLSHSRSWMSNRAGRKHSSEIFFVRIWSFIRNLPAFLPAHLHCCSAACLGRLLGGPGFQGYGPRADTIWTALESGSKFLGSMALDSPPCGLPQSQGPQRFQTSEWVCSLVCPTFFFLNGSLDSYHKPVYGGFWMMVIFFFLLQVTYCGYVTYIMWLKRHHWQVTLKL